MKFQNEIYTAREESFEIENPEVFLEGISSEITINESHDGLCHVKILANSKLTGFEIRRVRHNAPSNVLKRVADGRALVKCPVLHRELPGIGYDI